MSSQNMPCRIRLFYTVATFGVMLTGFVSRQIPGMFPAILGRYPGDTLWALMVFLCYCTLLPHAKTHKVAVLALITAYTIEFSQLYQAPWVNSIRGTTLGYLVLGTTFNWPDLVAFTLGIVAGAACDKLWLVHKCNQSL
jgi:hypothetical protein